MAMDGVTFEKLVREVWTPELVTAVFQNNWAFSQKLFPILPAPGGSKITTGIEVSIDSDVGTYNYDDAMVAPFNTVNVEAYFNKDHFQEAARLFNVYLDYMKNGGVEPSAFDAVKKALMTGTANLTDKMTTTMIADMESQVDSSSAYSDASLSRSTYPALKSYEEATSTALTIAHLEDAIEALLTRTTYGAGVRSEEDLAILMPRNQLTNLARLTVGASNFGLNTDSQNMGAVDAGRTFRVKSFEGIDLQVVPDMTSTTILIVNKPDVVVYETRPITWKPKDEKADTQLYQGTAAYNMVVGNPNNHAKLSAKTA